MDFNKFYDRIACVCVLPFRLLGGAIWTLYTFGALYINDKLGLNYLENIMDSGFYFIPKILGINMKIEKDKNYERFIKDRKNYILIFNHISIYDIFVVRLLCCRKISSLIVKYVYDMPIINTILSIFEMIPVERNNKSNSIEKITKFLNERGSLAISPDACNIIPEGKNIAEFKNGAFIPKADIYPTLFRYVPSYTHNINWDNNTFLESFIYNFIDGNMDVYVKVLKKEKYEDHYKSHEDYRDHVYKLMSEELKTLPDQYPPRLMSIEREESQIININICGLFIISLLKTEYLPLFFVNYMSWNYKTNNTILMGILCNLITIYSCFFRS
jgi:1-acyl-sn-glycerol-3-phosphate acyltransferase